MLQAEVGTLTTGANAIFAISFMVASYFLRDFVKSVREFMDDVNKRLAVVETQLSLSPGDVGSYSPPRRKQPKHFHRRD